MRIHDIVICITNKCNIKCGHCLRGSASNIMMDDKILKESINFINYYEPASVTISGGEPLLNQKAMTMLLSKVANQDTHFYIKTNGTIIPSTDLFLAISDLNFKYDYPISFVVSNSNYHIQACRGINRRFKDLIDMKVFGKEFAYVEETSNFSLIPQGRAKSHNVQNGIDKRYFDEFADFYYYYNDEPDDGELDIAYISLDGNIYSSCNISYKEEKTNKFKLSSIFDREAFEKNVIAKYDKQQKHQKGDING